MYLSVLASTGIVAAVRAPLTHPLMTSGFHPQTPF
jgi:hypothetical protein